MSFSKKGYEVVKNVITEQLLKNLKIEFEMIRDNQFYMAGESDKYAFGDPQCPNYTSHNLDLIKKLVNKHNVIRYN